MACGWGPGAPDDDYVVARLLQQTPWVYSEEGVPGEGERERIK